MTELLPIVGKLAENLTLIIAMLLVFVAGYKRIWVWGWQYDALAKDRDFWRDAAVQGKYMTERTVHLAEAVANKVEKP
jgi:hypothetical protein